MSNALTWFETGFHWLAILWALAVLTGAVALAVIGVRWWREGPEAAAFDAYLDDVENGYIDLPGPDPLRAPWPANNAPRETAGSLRAGELHYMDTWLGRPGDGSEHTALRVRREGEAMLARVEAARRELAAECGIRYVPMELVAA